MHTVYQRTSQVFATLSSCLMVLFAAVALSSYVLTTDPKGTLAVTSVKVVPGDQRHDGRTMREFAFVRFNLTADLTPLFHWNTKQLFLYLGAEYTNAEGVKNDVVIWDRIVRRKEDAIIKVNGKNKYVFKDLSKSFKNVKPAHYILKYNLMPYVGALTYGEAGRTEEPVPFPPVQGHIK